MYRSGKIGVFGHRGDSAHLPENTIAAFQAAMEQGADGIETDFRLTKDGVMVCFHDDTLERTAGRDVKVSDLTYEALNQLVLSHPFFQGNKVPRVADLCAWRPEGCLFMLELKDKQYRQPAVAAELLEILTKSTNFDNLWISSFDMESLETVRKLDPSIPLVFISRDYYSPADLWVDGYSPYYAVFEEHPELSLRAAELGKFITTWDPFPEQRYPQHKEWGTRFVTPNDPGAFVRLQQADR